MPLPRLLALAGTVLLAAGITVFGARWLAPRLGLDDGVPGLQMLLGLVAVLALWLWRRRG